MKNSNGRFVKAGCAILVGLVISQNQPAFGGWTGLINGLGVGWASANVRSATLQTNKVATVNNVTSPSATMPPTNGYMTNGPSPSGASSTTYSRIRGLSGGVWSAASKAAVGDGTDNPELQNRVAITPADCASLTFDSFINQSQSQFNANGNSGSITVNAKATAGTALWLRGFEYTGSMADVPIDDPNTVQNESIEYLKVNGIVKFETLVLGPFEFGGTNSNICPLTIPFTLTSSNLEHLIFASDAAVLSLPLVIICPPSMVVRCDEPFSYPPVQFAGCGDINITYSPARLAGPFPAGTFPVGVTPVTATATDGDGNSTSCTFTVTVTDTTPPAVPVLATLTGESSVTVPQPPPTTDNCGGVVTASTTDPLLYTNQGTFTVHWNFDDGHGNTNTANQTVIVDDVTAPVAPVLATVTGQCSATVPVPMASDAVVGNVTGTTSDPLTYNSQGTFTVHWTFNDGNGNSSTANQTVIVKDTIAPLVPVLATLTGESSVTVPQPPPTTDNCGGVVTASTTDPLLYTNQGTFTVHWNFDDGHGNTNTANQTVIVDDVTAPVAPVLATVTGQCSATVSVPTASDAVAGDITGTTSDPLTYNSQGTFTVHWTFNDGNGNSSTANQIVIVKDTIAPAVPILATVTGQCTATVTVPTAADICAGTVNGTTSGPLTYNSQGTFTVHWTFNDGNGNSSTANQIVIVKDTIAPAVPILATVTGQCTATVTVPTAADICAGTVNGTTSDPLTYNSQGTFTVHWTFNDGNGNSTNVNQTVIVKDTIPPVKPTLANLTFTICSGTPATPPTPTTQDYCKGLVSGTTTTTFPITNLGTTVVTWTFNDGNGNSTNASQTVNVTGLTFQGFYSPVGTSGNTVNNPVTRSSGASFPLKWDMLCGTNYMAGGPRPTVDIQKVLTKSPLTLGTADRLTADYQNDWHINWPTPDATKNDIYKATVNLPDGSKAFVFVIFK